MRGFLVPTSTMIISDYQTFSDLRTKLTPENMVFSGCPVANGKCKADSDLGSSKDNFP